VIIRVGIFVGLVFLVGVPLFALPATLSLPPGLRPGLEDLTLSQAAGQLIETGKSGLDLVEAARALVAERMIYSRRNSFDSYATAFARGYGYCSQQANALADLLSRLGFEAKVVHAFRNRFPDGRVASHAWVQVLVGGRVVYVDSLYYDAQRSEITFTPLSRVSEVSPAIKILERWGAGAVNAHRYYLTGKDRGW
jgi:transglutaminase-like putative cysteine protease